MISSKQDFFRLFQPVGPVVHSVDLPGGEAVFIRQLSAHETTQYELAISDKKTKGQEATRERLVVMCACDADGKRLFEDSDISTVGQLPPHVLDPIVKKAREIHWPDAKPIEDVRKNSDSSTSDV